MTEEFDHWSTEQLELAVEYRERVILGEVQRYAEITPEYLQEFGRMIVELSQRAERPTE